MDGFAPRIDRRPTCRLRAGAARLAAERFADEHAGRLSACGYELNRFYNVLEKSFERLCEAFENHFEKAGDDHERLLEQRNTLVIETPD